MLTFGFALLLLSFCTVALGQPPALDPMAVSIIETTDAGPIQTNAKTINAQTIDLQTTDVQTIDLQTTELLTTQSVQVPSPETSCNCIASCNCNAESQSIELRKNVLGCTACYNIPSTDEIWIVSARDNTCDPDNVSLLKVKKLANNKWQPSCLSDLTEAHRCDKDRSTLVYVHGNQTNYEYGVARGFQFYDNLFIKNDCPRPPVRLVLWLWKSEQEIPRPLPDYLVKSERAIVMGRSLTKTLEAFGDRRIAITGFSLGAQVILSSLEQMEPRCSCSVPATGDDKYQVALIAPATDPGYICEVINRNVESTIVDLSTIMVSKKDRVIKAMRVVIRRECPEARDPFSDLARQQHFPLGPLKFFEVSKEIGRKHAIENYTQSQTIQHAMRRVIQHVAARSYMSR